MLGAETEGAIGYMIEQELGNLLPFEKPLATLLTMVEVDPDDPAFQDPTKFVGQVYDEAEAKAEAAAKGWTVKPDGEQVAPGRALAAAEAHLPAPPDPVAAREGHRGDRRRRRRHPDHVREGHAAALVGVECVIDKDRATALLAREIGATRLRLRHRRRRGLSRLGQARPAGDPRAPPRTRWTRYSFPAGSMGPKVEAAQDFARATGGRAIICALADVPAAVRGEKGTTIAGDAGETGSTDARLRMRRRPTMADRATPRPSGPRPPRARSRRTAPARVSLKHNHRNGRNP